MKPVYTHDLSAQYIRSNAAKGRTFTLAVRFSASPNTIADSLVIDTPHFVIDGDGMELGEGKPVRAAGQSAGYWNLRTTLSYGFPVRWLRSNLNVRAGVTTRAYSERHQRNAQPSERGFVQCRADAGEQHLGERRFQNRLYGLLQREP